MIARLRQYDGVFISSVVIQHLIRNPVNDSSALPIHLMGLGSHFAQMASGLACGIVQISVFGIGN